MKAKKDKPVLNVEKDAKSFGYNDYKEIKFNYIEGITIQKFRSLQNRNVKLGKYLTLITGKNGTMKSSILGLIAHPFSSPNDAKDLYGKPLKTDHKNVFRLSPEKDDSDYAYYINAETSDGHHISEPVRLYARDGGSQFRLTVGASNLKGRGNFALNTSYINLKRLYPIIETKADKIQSELTAAETTKISNAYQAIMQRFAYNNIDSISDKQSKNTLAPAESYYDFNSISSGEDNLGHILCKLIAFERNNPEGNQLKGILCIDEIEASLHPSSQIGLIDYLIKWSKSNHIQVIITTHSLYLIDHCLRLQLTKPNGFDNIVINNISTMQVGGDNNYNIMVNPSFKTIYKELTFKNIDEPSPYKVNIICEDKIAEDAIKAIIKKRAILSNIDFISNLTDNTGNSCNALISLVKNGKKLLDDSIVILDPDIPNERISRLDQTYITKIPDIDNKNLCLERRVVYYIFNLDGAHELFRLKEKDAFLQSFTQLGIFQNNIINPHLLSTDPFKQWQQENKKLYKKALSYYLSDNSTLFDSFRNLILVLINTRRASKALPPLEY